MSLTSDGSESTDWLNNMDEMTLSYIESRKITEGPRTGFMCVETVILLDAPFPKRPLSGFVESVFDSANLLPARAGFGAAPQGFKRADFLMTRFLISSLLCDIANSAKRKPIKEHKAYQPQKKEIQKHKRKIQFKCPLCKEILNTSCDQQITHMQKHLKIRNMQKVIAMQLSQNSPTYQCYAIDYDTGKQCIRQSQGYRKHHGEQYPACIEHLKPEQTYLPITEISAPPASTRIWEKGQTISGNQ